MWEPHKAARACSSQNLSRIPCSWLLTSGGIPSNVTPLRKEAKPAGLLRTLLNQERSMTLRESEKLANQKVTQFNTELPVGTSATLLVQAIACTKPVELHQFLDELTGTLTRDSRARDDYHYLVMLKPVIEHLSEAASLLYQAIKKKGSI